MSQTTTMSESSSPNGYTTPTLLSTVPNGRPAPHTVLSPIRRAEQYLWERNDSHLVALLSFATGIVLAASLALAIANPATPQGWMFVTALSFFHFMEYYVTAKYKPFEVTLDGMFYNNCFGRNC
jgi:hypothetical protein